MKYETKADGIHPGPITRITDHASADVLPVFSPDGKQLMWTSNRTDNHESQLFIADFACRRNSGRGSIRLGARRRSARPASRGLRSNWRAA